MASKIAADAAYVLGCFRATLDRATAFSHEPVECTHYGDDARSFGHIFDWPVFN